MVFSLALHFTRSPAVAEELAQDVFLELYQNLRSIESPAHLRFWLRKVTTNRCIDLARKMKHQPQVSLEDAPELSFTQEMPDTALRRALQTMVAALPEKPRLVVILRYQEDLEPAEIAELLEMPIATVKSHLRRSLQILREKMSRRTGEMI